MKVVDSPDTFILARLVKTAFTVCLTIHTPMQLKVLSQFNSNAGLADFEKCQLVNVPS